MSSEHQVLAQCKAGSQRWKDAFNSGNGEGCGNQYSQKCTMKATPFGEFEGREAIIQFWTNIIKDGYNNVEYTDVDWVKVDESSYVLTATWTMNKCYGVITRELWRVQDNGEALLEEDSFEIQGKREE
eukprot:Nk52_evm13s219 gene=Nk52_evmTU13s219